MSKPKELKKQTSNIDNTEISSVKKWNKKSAVVFEDKKVFDKTQTN